MSEVRVPKVRPFLWLDADASEAAAFYVSLFANAKLCDGDEFGGKSVRFEIDGCEFIAFNGGPHFALTPAFSMFVDCTDQTEIDTLWAALSDGGEPMRCGWIKDRFGVTWQIVPRGLVDWLGDNDKDKAERVMATMLTMIKLDVAALRRAYEGT